MLPSEFLDREVIPALIRRLDAAFPEFGWVRRERYWIATRWPSDFPYTVEHKQPDRLVLYENRPYWIKVHGHEGLTWPALVNGGMQPTGRAFVDAVRELAKRAGVDTKPIDRELTIEEIENARVAAERQHALEVVIDHAQSVLWSDGRDAVAARSYLVTDRGFSDAEIRELGFGLYPTMASAQAALEAAKIDATPARKANVLWCPIVGYVVIPWYGADGQPLTMYGRWPGEPPSGKKKTLALPGENTKASPLYFDRVRRAAHREVVAVEGVFDAALLQLRGETRAVAYVGAQFSGEQVKTLVRHRVERVFLCGDPDGGGDRGTVRNIEHLSVAGIATYVVPRLPDGVDPDEFVRAQGIDAWRARVESAVPGHVFRAGVELGAVTPASTDRVRREAVTKALTYAASITGCGASLDIDSIVKLVAERTGYSAAAIAEEIGRLRENGRAPVAEDMPPSLFGDHGYVREMSSTPTAAQSPMRFPPRAEVDGLLSRCTPVFDDIALRRDLLARGIDPATVTDRAVAFVLPGDAALPTWARVHDGSWLQSGHRLLVPMYGPDANVVTLRAICMVGVGTASALSPAGHRDDDAVMADPLGRLLLAGGDVGWWTERTIIVVQGEIDFLSIACHYGDDESAPAVFGVTVASWSKRIAARVPDGARVVIRVDGDQDGETIARTVGASLKGRCQLFRSSPALKGARQ